MENSCFVFVSPLWGTLGNIQWSS